MTTYGIEVKPASWSDWLAALRAAWEYHKAERQDYLNHEGE